MHHPLFWKHFNSLVVDSSIAEVGYAEHLLQGIEMLLSSMPAHQTLLLLG